LLEVTALRKSYGSLVAVTSMGALIILFAFARVVFGVRIHGSMGLGFSAVALPIGLLLGCSLVFGTIAVVRFRWEAD
jgi:hypothetical protein